MLSYSKFVNTKAYQKASKKPGPLFPVFTKSASSVSRLRKQEAKLSEPIKDEELPAQRLQDEKPAAHIHQSVDFAEMQRREDLHKPDEDWLAFFMGESTEVKEEYVSQSTDLVHVPTEKPLFSSVPITTMPPLPTPVASSTPIVTPAPIITPAPPIAETAPACSQGPTCLEQIFNEMLEPEIEVSQRAPRIEALRQAQLEPKLEAAGPACLDEIFSEMISDNKVFKQSAS